MASEPANWAYKSSTNSYGIYGEKSSHDAKKFSSGFKIITQT